MSKRIDYNLRHTYQTGDGDGRPVASAHEEPPQDNLVEGGIRTTGQEPVQLDTSSMTVKKSTTNQLGAKHLFSQLKLW